MEVVIDFQFDYADRFFGGLANCRLPDGRRVLITKDGEITAESYDNLDNPNEISYFNNLAEPEFIYNSYDGTDVRDSKGSLLFTYDGNLSYLEHAKLFALSHFEPLTTEVARFLVRRAVASIAEVLHTLPKREFG